MHDRLRGPVPAAAISWVEHETGDTVVAQRALEGGNSSAVHRLTLRSGRGAERSVVLRRYVLDWVLDEPEAPGNEALVLGLLGSARTSFATPRLLATDLEGRACGAPTILMSALPGRVVWPHHDVDSWLVHLAEALPEIHALPVPAGLNDWAPYPPAESGAPTWSRHPAAWETAIAAFHGPRPAAERVFLHRDYHPGNVLWEDGAISGVVDWVSSCAGPPEEDVSHCRANLAIRLGQTYADRFLRIWQDVTGRGDYDPYYDLTGVVSFDLDAPEPRLDEFVAAAAAQLR